ncbi:MAG: FeoB-associated Cys-rich membrane protein [Candidatus Glassbacteria bacterium]|nr:FeoB-associated Cys-rich membrane protein [Candidatus Glassbacteria bacterium]
MLETTLVVLIVLAAAFFWLRSVIRTVKGKKSCCDITRDSCGSCNLSRPGPDKARDKRSRRPGTRLGR